MIVRALANKLAVGIKQAAPEHPASVEVLRYSLMMILNPVFAVSGALLISLFTGRTAEVAIILVSFALLRHVSGGVHLKSTEACILVSAGGATALSFITVDNLWTLILNIASCLLVLLFAPSRLEKSTWVQKQSYPTLRLIALLIVASNFLIQSPVMAVAFFTQALTLIKK